MKYEVQSGLREGTPFWATEADDLYESALDAFAAKATYENKYRSLQFRVVRDGKVFEKYEDTFGIEPTPGEQPTEVDSKVATSAAKVPLDLVPMRGLKGVARVLGYGRKKHGHGNYLNATDDEAPQRYMGAAFRHEASLQAPGGKFTWESVTQRDEESGLYEIDHAICSLLMLRDIAIKLGHMDADPGIGNEPPAKETK